MMILMVMLIQEAPLQELEWMIGEWEGSAAYGEQKVKTRFAYSWTKNRAFIQWTYQARDGDKVLFESTGFLGWDREQKKLAEFGFGMDGTIGWGRGGLTEKDTWVFEGKLSTDAPFKEIRKTIKKSGADRYAETVLAKQGDKWVTAFSCEYARKQ